MGAAKNVGYRGLEVWREGIALVKQVYQLAASLPADEKYGLASQVRRSSVSIPANIAEGYGRRHRREYLHHLYTARGSLFETETYLILADELALAGASDLRRVWRQSQTVGRLLNGLIRALESRPQAPIPDPRSPIPTPRSPIPSSSRQRRSDS